MAGTPTFGAVTNAADYRIFTLHLMDASGDSWTEQLLTALAATYTAINAWIVLYQLTTQAQIFKVEEINTWAGDADPDFADNAMRSGGETGVNLSFKNANTRELRPLRVIAPVPDIMQGNQDIPLLTADALSDLIIATAALQSGFGLQSAQYTVHRERKGNPKVKA